MLPELVVLASIEKLGTVAPYVIAPATEISYLITERTVSQDVLRPDEQLGVTMLQS